VLFKYFIEFDDSGGIKNFHESQEECKNCKEYLVKLISIDRRQEELEQKADEFGKAADKLLSNTKKFDTELNKMLKDLRRKRI
jgi:hypothetical protein